MRVVVQRVLEASVTILGTRTAQIGLGALILVGIEEGDTANEVDWLTSKIANLRIFNDEMGVMNYSLIEIKGEAMVVSQFTLHASTKKGKRPSYIKAAKPEIAVPLYEYFIQSLEKAITKPVQTGTFGADMKVALINDGPVTILIDTKNRE